MTQYIFTILDGRQPVQPVNNEKVIINYMLILIMAL